MPYAPTAKINLAAVSHNLSVARKLAPQSKILAVIKADGYGHGIGQIAEALSHADAFAIARIEEALTLRQENFSHRLVLLCGFSHSTELNLCAEYDIDCVIHSWHQLDILLNTTLSQPINIWLKLDTGMHRLGLTLDEFKQAYLALSQSTNVAETLLMTHFSAAEDPNSKQTQAQQDLFQQATRELSSPVSLANSAAIISLPETHTDWVRPGIMLYGANPIAASNPIEPRIDLKPVMTLSTHVISIHEIPAGECVGYNSRWTASKPSKIATLAIGYGDGYPRHAKNGTPTLINGQRVPLVGTVSMDLITVDISDCETIQIGDEAILWGEDNSGTILAAEEIACCADTISYQLFTSITQRVARIYSR